MAVREAGRLLSSGTSALDAVEKGINVVELDTQDQYYVGKGGLPNAEGVMELDAALMDHESRYSAVLCLQDISTPVSVARKVLDHSPHNVLTGAGALKFALAHGFVADPSVLTDSSAREWQEWKQKQEREQVQVQVQKGPHQQAEDKGHDTVGLICLDSEGRLACGTSTSGWKFKHPGRVGDSPIPGGGLYCDGAVGAAVCTGDGEEIQRSCLAFLVVELMRAGHSPQAACAEGIRRICKLRPKNYSGSGSGMYPQLTVGVIAMDPLGNVGAASTLCEANKHRDHPFFPVMCWRAAQGDAGQQGAQSVAEPLLSLSLLEASVEGATF